MVIFSFFFFVKLTELASKPHDISVTVKESNGSSHKSILGGDTKVHDENKAANIPATVEISSNIKSSGVFLALKPTYLGVLL